jgi:hypothetical protein
MPTIAKVQTAADENDNTTGDAKDAPPKAEVAIQEVKPVNLKGKDKYECFELQLPFASIKCVDFWGAIVEAKKECGNESYVTLDSLVKHLTSPSWAPLKDPNSVVSKILLSGRFKDDDSGETEEQINFNILAMFALVMCSGKAVEKVEVFYNILQEGGVQDHSHISATDKDNYVSFNKIAKFCTVWLFEFASEHGGIDNIFADNMEALEKVIDNDDEDESFYADILNDVYGNSSKLEFKDWCDAMTKLKPWFFNSSDLRKKIFEAAQITYKA